MQLHRGYDPITRPKLICIPLAARQMQNNYLSAFWFLKGQIAQLST
jgi:hypothetical protein